MARCVPYTPLRRAARDPVAEAMREREPELEPEPEPAAADKLQKEREMMQKKERKERKEEKKRQKKASQLGEKHEISSHHSKHGHKKRKLEGQNIVALEMRKDLKDIVEQLEKSGLSEEHEAPSCSLALDGTLESSLDSNKRLRATVSPSPSQSRNGVLRVKIASTNQRRGPESTAVSAKPRTREQQSVKQMGLDLSMAKSQSSEFQPLSDTVKVAKQLVASEQKMTLWSGTQLSESRQLNQQQPAIVTQRVSMVPTVTPQPTPKVMQRVDPPPTKVLRRVETAPMKGMQRAGQLMPSKVFQRDAPQVPANMSEKLTAIAAPPGQLNVKLPALLHKPKTSVEPPVFKQLRQMDAIPKDDLFSVGTSVASTPQQKMALRNGNQQGESRQISRQQPAMVIQRANLLPRDSPQSTQKMLQRVNPPSRNVLQRADLARANVMQKPDRLMPSKVFERDTPQVPDAPLGRPNVERPALLHRPKVSVEAPLVKPQHDTDALPKGDPFTVTTSIAAALAQEVKQFSSGRKNRKAEKKEREKRKTEKKEREKRKAEKKEREKRKAEKKEREYADLFVTWKPSPIQMEEHMDVDDQDWLFSCGVTPRSDRGTFDGSMRCQPAVQLCSLQPRAVHLPDLNMYQLPYVVPF